MNHDSISARFNIGAATVDGVVLSGTGNERFAACKDHEVICNLCLFADLDFVAMILDGRLMLDVALLNERVLLEPDFILDDDRRDAKAFKRTDEKHEVFGESTGVTVVDDGLGCHFEDVVHGTETRGDIYRFIVGLALQRGVGERREPHRVELVLHLGAVRIGGILRHHHARVLDDESGKSAVRFHHAHDGLCIKEAAQTATADIRCGTDFAYGLVELSGGYARSVLRLYELAAPLSKCVNHTLACLRLNALSPVCAMNNEIRLELEKVRDVVELLLRDNFVHAFESTHHGSALLVVHVRQALVARDRSISENPDGYIAELGCFLDDVQVAGVDDVRRHCYVNFLCHCIAFPFLIRFL